MNVGSVSVVIPAYNVAWCVKRAIDSVLCQTLPPAEILVVNDGSTDNSATLVSEFGEAVTLINQSNSGLSNARNTGIRLAKSEWVAFLDADDYWLPEKLERQLGALADHPDVGFCSTCTRVEDTEGKPMGLWGCPVLDDTILKSLFTRNACVAGSGSSVVAQRNLMLQAGLFDESLHSLEDIDMWMRLAAITDYLCIPDPQTVIIKRPGSMSGNLDVMRSAALTVMHKNRHLLAEKDRGRFWNGAYANVLSDYAKWEYRSGRRWTAMRHLTEGLLRAPLKHGRALTGLLVAMLLKQKMQSNN